MVPLNIYWQSIHACWLKPCQIGKTPNNKDFGTVHSTCVFVMQGSSHACKNINVDPAIRPLFGLLDHVTNYKDL
jgi:hypothetical protein